MKIMVFGFIGEKSQFKYNGQNCKSLGWYFLDQLEKILWILRF